MRQIMIKLGIALFVAATAITTIEIGNLLVADGGGDLIPNFEKAPVILVDGGGDLIPEVKRPPIVLADGGGDYSPSVESDNSNIPV